MLDKNQTNEIVMLFEKVTLDPESRGKYIFFSLSFGNIPHLLVTGCKRRFCYNVLRLLRKRETLSPVDDKIDFLFSYFCFHFVLVIEKYFIIP